MIYEKQLYVSDEQIRMQRAKLHITQDELAKKSGLTRAKIVAIENNKCKKVSEEILEKLAKVFKLKVKDLLKKEER